MKIIKNMLIILSFCAIGAINAKQTGGKAVAPVQAPQAQIQAQQQPQQPQQVQQQVSPQQGMQQQQVGQQQINQQAQPVSQTQWLLIIQELTAKIPSTSRIKEIKKLKLTDDQRLMLTMIERNINLEKQLRLEKIQTLKAQQAKKGAKIKAGWLDWLWGGAEWGTTAYKNMIKDKLDDTEKYPTANIKKEALDLGIEFNESGYDDVKTMKVAQNELKNELNAEVLSPEAQKEQQMVDEMIAKLRDEFGFDLSEIVSIKDIKAQEIMAYIQNLKKGIKNFVINNINNENATAILKAITSELKRAQNILDIVKATAVTPATAPVSGPQGSK